MSLALVRTAYGAPPKTKSHPQKNKKEPIRVKPIAPTLLLDIKLRAELAAESKIRPTSSESVDPFAYRHYDACHPTANKLLSKKWEERSHSLHVKKVTEMKASVDNSPPKVYAHLEVRLKKLKLEEGTISSIVSHFLLIAYSFDKRSSKRHQA